MQVRGVTPSELEGAATDVGVRLSNLKPKGTGYTFTLSLEGELWRRRSPSGRKIGAVCFHGYSAFMQRVFGFNPHAVIISGMDRYNGVAEFQTKACEVGDRNIGSRMEWTSYNEACDCVGDLREAIV